ncbi:MAG: FAD-dependent oxidoreductase [Dehalococcoidales bacterium]|nr:FAD-dependent oxidoreductase [Dehalococcoidales bacterium]
MEQSFKWDMEYDVVVAGNGGSGISAAVTAHDLGSSVIILEKAPHPGGGQTRTSGLGAAFATDPEGAAQYLYAASSNGLENADGSGRISVTPLEDCRVFMQEMALTPQWLKSMGIDHNIRTGSSAFYPFPGADSFGHVVMKGWGQRFLEVMQDHLDKRGIRVLYATPAVELIQDPMTREIAGVYALREGQKIAVKARKGVVLCTGGFEFDEEMKANYLRPYPMKFSGWPYNTGDGIKMAQKAGADLWHMNTICGYLNIWVPESPTAWLLRFRYGVWVNKYGRRYTNEGTKLNHNWWLKFFDYDLDEPGYLDVPTYMLFDDNERQMGAISGNCSTDPQHVLGIQSYPAELGGVPEGWSRDNLREVAKGWIKKADTIEELAGMLGNRMDHSVLKETIERYNSFCAQGKDLDYNRDADTMRPVSTPPFYACVLYPGGINTLGGPRRNGYGQVLDPYKQVIPRLLSAGEMGSICGNLYAIGGLNAGEMLASGRLAGKTAAALKNRDG